MIIHRVHQAELQEVEILDETSRNTGGFGHTGK
jgi:dUTPase